MSAARAPLSRSTLAYLVEKEVSSLAAQVARDVAETRHTGRHRGGREESPRRRHAEPHMKTGGLLDIEVSLQDGFEKVEDGIGDFSLVRGPLIMSMSSSHRVAEVPTANQALSVAIETLTSGPNASSVTGMSNVFDDTKQQQVLALGRLGWSLRRIEQALAVRRETISSYLKAAGSGSPSIRCASKCLSFHPATHRDSRTKES